MNPFLQEMGITQYQLRKSVDQQEGTNKPWVKLLVVVEDRQQTTHPLFSNIIAATKLEAPQWSVCQPEQVSLAMANLSERGVIWQVGGTPITDKRVIQTQSITELADNKSQKQALWQAIKGLAQSD